MVANDAMGDRIDIEVTGNENRYGSTMDVRHGSEYFEGLGGDNAWFAMPNDPDNKWLMIYTDPYVLRLQSDGRPTSSETIFRAKLIVIDKIGDGFTTSSRLNLLSLDLDASRHYTAYIHYDNTYAANGSNYYISVNIRDVNEFRNYVELPGIVNCPSGVVFGTVDINPQFNRLVSSNVGGGTNGFEGNIILAYDTSTNITLAANPDNYLSQYILTRTDNTGIVSVVTNILPDQTVTTTNIAINNIKGRNAIFAVYSPRTTLNGIPHPWLTAHGIANKEDSVETNNVDGDAFNNLQEYLADTNPTNKDSSLTITNIASISEGILVNWTGGSLVTQYLERCYDLSTNLPAWSPFFTNNPPTTTQTNILDTGNTNGQVYYRIRVVR